MYLAGNDAGRRPDLPDRERPTADAAGRGKQPAATAGRPRRHNSKTALPGAASVAVQAAPSARYAALGAASALAAGSPTAFAAACAASGSRAAASR